MCLELWLLVLKPVVRQRAAPHIFRVGTALFSQAPAWKRASGFLALKHRFCSITTPKNECIGASFPPSCVEVLKHLTRCFNHKGQVEKQRGMTSELSVFLSAL